MSAIHETRALAETHGLEFSDCGNGHVQIKGHGNLVNYYPLSKKRSLWSPTLNRRETQCTPWDAVRLCMATAKPGMKPKAKPPKNKPDVSLKPFVTNPAGLKHFYDGEVPPWDPACLECWEQPYSDKVRLAALELERDAMAMRAEANDLDEEMAT